MIGEEARAYIQEWLKDEYALNSTDREALDMAIKALEQEPVLDKIRAEIEPTRKMYLEMNDIDWLNGCDYVLSIIEKYRAESEE